MTSSNTSTRLTEPVTDALKQRFFSVISAVLYYQANAVICESGHDSLAHQHFTVNVRALTAAVSQWLLLQNCKVTFV